jgi:hypothetical protein
LLVAGLVVGGWQLWGHLFGEDAAAGKLANQLWIERLPRDARDLVFYTVALDHEGRRVGAAGRASQWRLHSDNFVWRLEGDRVRTRFPQDDQRLDFRVRSWACEGQAPKPFELCLELKRGQRSFRLYSRKEWVVRPHGEGAAPAEIAWLSPALQRALAAAPTDEPAVDGPESEDAGWAAFDDDAP